MPSDLLDRWSPHVDVYIAYGPTEASIQSAGIRIPIGSSSIPSGIIGRATGCNMWVVGEENHSELVPWGEVGELVVEGHTLARGYLHDPKKTAAAFVDISIGREHRRVFKTGDLVRYNSDGELIFIGRKDTQVKIQGQRFELTEIEARLSPILGVGSKCCVEKVENIPALGQNSLCAFISTSIGDSDSMDTGINWDQVEATLESVPKIRKSLSKVLPAAMIPSLYVPLLFIPLTVSRKTDRKALRQLVESLSYEEQQQLREPRRTECAAQPLSANELVLRELWALVLHREAETIMSDSNFIEMGGDSVTSIKLISAARNRGITLTSAMVLSSPVLSEQARKVSAKNVPEDVEIIPPFSLLGGRTAELRGTAAAICGLSVEEIEDVLPMTMNQMRWYGKTLIKPDAWIDQYCFQLPQDVDFGRFVSALDSTIEAAELLRARIIATADKKLLQAITKFHSVDVCKVQDALEAYLKRDLDTPMGLGAPLSRYALITTNGTAVTFVWTIHHAIYDGYSFSMLLQTIQQFYNGLSPAPFTPFNRYLKGPGDGNLANGHAFWEKYLSGSSWTRFPASPILEEKSAPRMNRLLQTIDISQDTAWSHAPKKYPGSTTTANVVRVAYAIALSHHSTDQDDNVLFLESLGGRNSSLPGIDRIAGPTLLTIPTRLYLPGPKPRAEVLAQAHASLVERMRFENFPLPRLLQLAPALELRNILMIEDDAFLIDGCGEGLFGRGTEELKLEETEGLPMIFRCTVRPDAVSVDIRYDESVVPGSEIEAFLDTFRGGFKQLLQEDGGQEVGAMLQH